MFWRIGNLSYRHFKANWIKLCQLPTSAFCSLSLCQNVCLSVCFSVNLSLPHKATHPIFSLTHNPIWLQISYCYSTFSACCKIFWISLSCKKYLHICLSTFSETMACVCVATHQHSIMQIIYYNTDNTEWQTSSTKSQKIDQPTVNICVLWGYWHHIVLQSLQLCSLGSNLIPVWFCQES